MEKILKNYGRYLLLQSQLPDLEREKEDARRIALAAEREKSQRKVKWECLKDPDFFQRLLGKVEEKKEAAYRVYQEADTAWKKACQASEAAACAWEKVNVELDTLAQAEKQYTMLEKTEEVKVLAMEAFRPAAQYNLRCVLDALEQTLEWERGELGTMGNSPEHGTKLLKRLAAAKESAEKLRYILAQFPEPDSWVCDYLRNPDGFIHDGIIMKFSPRDRIRTAIGQVEQLKTRLQ